MSQDRYVVALMLWVLVFRSAWKAFHELLPILINKGISLVNCRIVFKACVRSVFLYGSGTWSLSKENLSQFKRCDHAICWLCNVKKEQKHSTEDLRRKIHVHYIEDIFRWNRLRLSGHLSTGDIMDKVDMSFNVDGPTSWGRPMLMWKDVVNTDLCNKHLNISLASDRSK